MSTDLKIDEIGYWSEVKLAILEEYAKPYNQILLAQKPKLHPSYIDGFAGAGHHKAKGADRIIEGSPTRALSVEPPFEAFYFVDSNEERTSELKRLSTGRPEVNVYHGDCNEVLLRDVFPKIKFTNFQRALCILDPYGLHLNWDTIRGAGVSKAIEIFLNFPVMDMNRNVLWHNSELVSESDRERMTKFWGDDSWLKAAYSLTQGLFGEMQEKNTNDHVVQAFRERLKNDAGFKFVPEPMPMRNSRGAVVYYLFFAAQQHAANKIVKDIFAKYEHYGEVRND